MTQGFNSPHENPFGAQQNVHYLNQFLNQLGSLPFENQVLQQLIPLHYFA